MTYHFSSSDVCRCGHTRLQHRVGGACLDLSCTCSRFRRRVAEPAAVPSAPGMVCERCRHAKHGYLQCAADNPDGEQERCWCATGPFQSKETK